MRRVDRGFETPEIISMVLVFLSFSSFTTGFVLKLVEGFDSAKHGIESDGNNLWSFVLIVLSFVLLLASISVGAIEYDANTSILLASAFATMMILAFCTLPRYAVIHFGNIESNMESIIEDKGFSDVDIVTDKQEKKELLQEFDNPDKKSAYPNQLATAHKDGKDYVLLIGFKENKESLIQEQIVVDAI